MTQLYGPQTASLKPENTIGTGDYAPAVKPKGQTELNFD